jgi:hypothetical protein
LADGILAIGTRVPVPALHAAMEDWFRKKSYLPPGARLIVQELADQDAGKVGPGRPSA